jgi:HD superfamily phosphodiesterase
MSLYTTLFNFVLGTIAKYNIDESHGLSHSMNVLHNAHTLYQSELKRHPYLEDQEKIIYSSAILHDMCDNKYMDVENGLNEINNVLTSDLSQEEINIVKTIINTMSYSKVKKQGFPSMGNYQLAYHIVRESDLLAAYDFDRCMIYHMNKNDSDVRKAFHNAEELFDNRVLRHHEDNLLVTEYSQSQHTLLSSSARIRMRSWKNILKI